MYKTLYIAKVTIYQGRQTSLSYGDERRLSITDWDSSSVRHTVRIIVTWEAIWSSDTDGMLHKWWLLSSDIMEPIGDGCGDGGVILDLGLWWPWLSVGEFCRPLVASSLNVFKQASRCSFSFCWISRSNVISVELNFWICRTHSEKPAMNWPTAKGSVRSTKKK